MARKCLSIITVLCVMFSLSACETMVQQIVKPVPYGMEELPEGTPIFQAGWKDGCDTGLTVYGNDRYKAAYGWTQDPKMVLNDEYYRAWKDAYTYCRWYAVNWVRDAR